MIRIYFSKIYSGIISIIHTLFTILVVICFSKFKRIKKIRSSKKLHVLLNGPSLDTSLINIDKENFDFFIANDFPRTDTFFELRPNKYLIVDPFFFDNKSSRVKDICSSLREADWSIEIYLPYKFKNSHFHSLESKSNISLKFFNEIPIFSQSFFKYQFFDSHLCMPKCQNVLIAILMLSIWEGYENIYLHGADHNWSKYFELNDQMKLCLRPHRFYDKDENQLTPWIDNYQNTYRVSNAFYNLYLMFNGYDDISKYADYKNINIINKTENSLIDAFER